MPFWQWKTTSLCTALGRTLPARPALCSALVRRTWSTGSGSRIPQYKVHGHTGTSLNEGDEWLSNWCIQYMRRGWKRCSSWRRKCLPGSHPLVGMTWIYMSKEDRGRLFSVGSQWRDKRQWAQTKPQKTPFKHKKKAFLWWVWSNARESCPRRLWSSIIFITWLDTILSNVLQLTLFCRGWDCRHWEISSRLNYYEIAGFLWCWPLKYEWKTNYTAST